MTGDSLKFKYGEVDLEGTVINDTISNKTKNQVFVVLVTKTQPNGNLQLDLEEIKDAACWKDIAKRKILFIKS